MLPKAKLRFIFVLDTDELLSSFSLQELSSESFISW
ncbi:unnamed protein product [Schistosoma mattheei]|uniref:Uncharacterized protein n=1 Tax=Schistosoma mattheei TaxID=31246 RepID=A0A3P8GH85_9TREM|nr:unnamed protein product [Schistosoma mattheei]